MAASSGASPTPKSPATPGCISLKRGAQLTCPGPATGRRGARVRFTNDASVAIWRCRFRSAGRRPSGRVARAPHSRIVVTLSVDAPRRNAIQRHHTVTHLLHWALHEVVSKEASQKGSFVGPDKLTFDFNSAPLTPQQVADIEKLVNERILENAGVSWTEVPYADVKIRKDVMQFFGDKYGDTVRVVQIGGARAEARRLFDGTLRRHAHARDRRDRFVPHRRRKRRSPPACGASKPSPASKPIARRRDEVALIKSLAGKVNSPVHELEKKIEALLAHQKELEKAAQVGACNATPSNAASELLGASADRERHPAHHRTISATRMAISCRPSRIRSRAGSRAWSCLAAVANGAVDARRRGLRRFHRENSGRKNHPGHRADRRRQRRRQTGQRARRRQGRGQAGRGAGESAELVEGDKVMRGLGCESRQHTYITIGFLLVFITHSFAARDRNQRNQARTSSGSGCQWQAH